MGQNELQTGLARRGNVTLYEAERASIPLSLMTIDDLVEAAIQNYDRLDIETQQLLPLKRIYWPA